MVHRSRQGMLRPIKCHYVHLTHVNPIESTSLGSPRHSELGLHDGQAGTNALSRSSSGADAHAGAGRVVSRTASETGNSQQLAVHFALPPHLQDPTLGDPQGPSTQDEYITSSSTAHSAPSSCPSTPLTDIMLLDSSTEHLEILLPSENLVLRGVGQDVEPTTLSGQVVLRLANSAHIREVNLTLIGKSSLPQSDARSSSVNAVLPVTPTTNPFHVIRSFRQHLATHVIFSHEWTLLEAAKGQKHTLAAGQHAFPFQLNVDDTFPASVNVGGSDISYKLRATVIRSSFSSNWVARRKLNIVRGFLPEALEYTQSLEIENTWPGKV